MKIVILDGYTTNPGDLDWIAITNLGDCAIYDRTAPSELHARAKEADILLTNKTILDATTLSSLPNVKYIGVLATGYNVVDIDYAMERGITVTNIPNYTGKSGAQMVFALLLELTNRVGHHSNAVFQNRWSQAEDFCFWDYPMVELDGLTLGIVGYGGIGKTVAQIASAFGMKVLVSTRTIPDNVPDSITFCSLDTIFDDSDVISLHCPLTPKTEGMINEDRLKQMKSNAYLINISRGPLVNEDALANALNANVIGGAALDVLVREPADPHCPLLKAKNCVITPHIAWATEASRRRLIDIAANNIKAFLTGEKLNVISR